MCGIAGYIAARSTDRPVADRLRAMVDRLFHRGPDDHGFCQSGGATIGMRRLSIVGIDNGAQPLFDESGRFAIVGNGEIYNAPQLHRELLSRGHRFQSDSDIEVVLHLFEELGPNAFQRLNGMFALAILDRREQRVLLARDRLGIKPLFVADTTHGFAFASEVPALLAGLDAEERNETDLDRPALADYLRHGYAPGTQTLYRSVEQLPPGSFAWANEAGMGRPVEWWTMPELEPEDRSIDSFAEESESILRDSVRLRTLGDVPAGAFLSGGLDSGTIVALLSESVDHSVPAFTLSIGDPEFDETADARLTAEAFGCEHHVERLDQTTAEEVESLFESYGEPFADASLLPTHRVSQLAARHVKYVLSGDGGDELFAGYAWLIREAKLRRLPRSVRTTARWLAPILSRGQQSTRSGIFGQALRAVGDLSSPAQRSFIRRRSLTTPQQLASLLHPELRSLADEPSSLERYADAHPHDSELAGLLDLDRRFYLGGDILAKVDRATMRHSLEARVPFLDHRLVELAARIPIETQLGPHAAGKAVLRRVIERVLPPELLQRRKRGFGIPVDRWLAGPLYQPLRDRLLDPSFRERGWIDSVAVERILDQHQRGHGRHGHLLWALWSLAVWSTSHARTPGMVGV